MEAGLRTVRANWADTLLVCRKCSKKLDGGFGAKGRTPLAKALRKDLAVGKSRKGAFGIVEVKCLNVCPKDAVAVVRGTRPGEWLLVPRGAKLDDVVDALLPKRAHAASPNVRSR